MSSPARRVKPCPLTRRAFCFGVSFPKERAYFVKPPKQIEVLTLNPTPSGGALLATASVRVGQLVFHHVRLIDDPVGGMAVAGPQIVKQTPTGQRHQTLVSWPKPWRTAILSKVQEAYNAQLQKPGGAL